MSSLTITGKLHSATNAEQKGDNFTVRQFTLELTENGANGQVFTNYAGFQLTNDKCALLNNFHQGQPVTVHFNIRGSLWQGKTITNLQAWKIEAVATQQPAQAPQPQYQPPQTPPAQQWQQPAPAAQPQQWPQQPQQAPPQQQPQQWGQPQQAPQPAQPQQWGPPAQQTNDLPF